MPHPRLRNTDDCDNYPDTGGRKEVLPVSRVGHPLISDTGAILRPGSGVGGSAVDLREHCNWPTPFLSIGRYVEGT
jgi:hypothetical protein